MLTRKTYESARADAWERCARKTLSGQLSPRCLSFLFVALRAEEQRQGGYCAPLISPYRRLSLNGFVSPNVVGQYLREANGIAIELKVGQPVIGGAASEFRRLTIEEMKTRRVEAQLRHTNSNPAEDISRRLNGLTIPWIGENVSPTFTVKKTGRIYAKRPNVQADKKRLDNIAIGLSEDVSVVEFDYRQAEPTVLKHLLHLEKLLPANDWPPDIYQSLATAAGITRDSAKDLFLQIIYSPNAKAALHNIGTVSSCPFWIKFVAALEKYKERLWVRGKPSKAGRRFTITANGHRVEALKGESMHKGKLLSWVVQGTVADFINTALLRLMELEQTNSWRVLYPVHDSIIITAKTASFDAIENIMLQAAKASDMGMQVSKEVRQGKKGTQGTGGDGY